MFAMVALAMNAQTQKLPVLKVTFDGAFNAKMDYLPGFMELTDADGKVVNLPAKFKTRGATAKQYLMKPSFNMKLRNDDYTAQQDSALLGMRSCSSWILDAMAIDCIGMRNRVCFDIWNQFSRLPYDTQFDGRNGTEGRFVEVYINNEYKGIYCLSDRINRKLLNLKKVKENPDNTFQVRGVLYKSGTNSIANQNTPGYNDDYTACVVEWHNAWELAEPDEEYACEAAWQPLQDLFAGKRSYDEVKKYFYLDNMVDYQLFVMAFSISDNWGNKNHFFSVRNITKDIDDVEPTEAARRKFVITPWDLDTSLGGSYNGSNSDGNYSNWRVADVVKNGGFYPFSICQGQAEYQQMLRNRWATLRKGALSVENVCKVMDSYRDLFINTGAWSRMLTHFNAQKAKPKHVDDLAKEVGLVEQWYKARFAEMDNYFGTTSSGIHSVEANAADNSTEIYDLQGRKVSQPQQHGVYIKGGKKVLF